MTKLVILKLGNGTFEEGFPVTLQIGTDGKRASLEIPGKLSSATEIPQSYQSWKQAYNRLGLRSRLEAKTNTITNISNIEDCLNAAQRLRDRLNRWLACESFRPIREKLLEQLIPSDEIRIVIQTEEPELQRLPWHLWDLCDRYPNAEIALSATAYEQTERSTPTNKVKILAILGHSAGIDIQADRIVLEQLPDAEICFLVEPEREELSDNLWKQNWDILFFAGHSSSGSHQTTGFIHINPTESLTIEQLKYGLRKAVKGGLKIAIFNSCDGLGLARDLALLDIPQIILMREPVPDPVAQQFLKYFLEAFSRGNSLYLAVREARERLQGLENKIPCATWLPLIFQNPAVLPPLWHDLYRQPEPISPTPPPSALEGCRENRDSIPVPSSGVYSGLATPSLPVCPFYAGSMITDSQYFVGRREELDFIAAQMTTAQPHSINIVGERRIGKSSLLYHFFLTYGQRVGRYGKSANDYAVVYLSLEQAQCQTQDGFYQAVAQKLLNHASARGNPALEQPLNSGNLERVAFFEAMEAWKVQNVLPVICLDDFEEFLENTEEFDDGFYDNLRALMNHNALMLVVASRKNLDIYSRQQQLTSVFFNLFRILPVEGLPEREVRELLKLPQTTVPERPVALAASNRTLAMQWGDKHPYLLQLAAQCLWEAQTHYRPETWAKEQFEREAKRLPPSRYDPLRPLRWLFWEAPVRLGRMASFLGARRADFMNWIAGIVILIAPVLLLLGAVKLEQIKDWIGK